MDIPILLPSKVWAEEFEGHEVPEVDAATKVRYECEAWCQHPVVLGASNPSRVVPGALYVDGVQKRLGQAKWMSLNTGTTASLK